MATKLFKTVTRETLGLKAMRNHKPIIVSLEAGDSLSFRVKGERMSYDIGLGHCLVLAKMMTADKIYKKKLEAFNQKKKEGKRAKRPKKPFLPYSKFYYNALK